ncbi:helix-turn-helix transcriptional regulator [Utexia brackfieldae]|uniref:helix-turn-helix transcriptional regulator n=1 Tax=Utexia brackfieldae TaxID=3074108 RepID=UPI00370DDCD7
MPLSIESVISELVDESRVIKNCYCSSYDSAVPPKLAYQVNFPRLEMIVQGSQEMSWHQDNQVIEKTLFANDMLFVCPRSWNKPTWSTPVTTLSLLFGKQQLGLSLLHWNGTEFLSLEQCNTGRRGPRIGSFMIQTLIELSMNYDQKRSHKTANLLIRSLLSHSLELLTSQFETKPKTTILFEAVRSYIDHHFQEEISRNLLAQLFHISPNYLSALFQKEGNIGLNEYIIQTRLEHAKTRLKQYDHTIKEIAVASGFQDSNYFCRVFRKKTDRSPSEYRKQYHSKIYDKV